MGSEGVEHVCVSGGDVEGEVAASGSVESGRVCGEGVNGGGVEGGGDGGEKRLAVDLLRAVVCGC